MSQQQPPDLSQSQFMTGSTTTGSNGAATGSSAVGNSKWLDDYRQQLNGHDELWAGDEIREPWRNLVNWISSNGHDALDAGSREAKRLFRENGIGYSASHTTDDTGARSWELDPLPHLIPHDDWERLESGLRQRAQIMDLVVRDLYGPRQLLKSGVLPPEVLFRNRQFALPCDGSLHDELNPLTFYCADVGRDSEGNFRVFRDRGRLSMGAGLALETRLVTARLLPHLIRQQGIHRQANYYNALLNNLQAVAPNRRLDPRIVTLSVESDGMEGFDHAYLANYLGHSLVSGDDLTVRDGRVWLKTIEGLKLVDIIVRRMSDYKSDPLELDPASTAGVPGLLEAYRRGNVVLANAIGCNIIESPAIMAFLADIARRSMGQELLLDSVPTRWCGTQEGLAQTLDELQQNIIYRIDDNDGIHGPDLDSAAQSALRQQISAEPRLYVSQSLTRRATTPAFINGAVQPRTALTRHFVINSEGEQNPVVLPGGFTRISATDNFSVGLSRTDGGLCKDTWVEAGAHEKHLIRWPRITGRALEVAVPDSLPSRAAEALYWVGRSTETAESSARLVRSVASALFDSEDYNDTSASISSAKLLQTLCSINNVPADDGEDTNALLRRLVTDQKTWGSLFSQVQRVESHASSVRDRWSADTWRIFDDLRMEFQQNQSLSQYWRTRNVVSVADAVVDTLMSFAGMTGEGMTREDGWRFLRIGRRVERAQRLCMVLDHLLVDECEESVEHDLLSAVLAASESSITHRRRHRAFTSVESVLDLLLLESSNPRALLYQVADLQRLIYDLPKPNPSHRKNAEERAVLRLQTDIQLVNVENLSAIQQGSRTALRETLNTTLQGLAEINEGLNHTYFAHVKARQLMPNEETHGPSLVETAGKS